MKIDLRNNRPKVERLPDDRLRATFSFNVIEQVGRTKAEILAECWLAYGTEAPGDFAGLRLIKQDLEGLSPNKDGSLPLVRVYEEMPATAEIQVGHNTVQLLDDGRKAIAAEFIQLSSAAATPGTVGTTTAPGDASAAMLGEEATDDGTLRRIKRTYVYAGTLSQNDDTKNNGKLLTRTVVSIRTAPSTPGGYTLVSAEVKSPNGVPVYTYQFAKGLGRISLDTAFKQNGKLQIVTVRFLDTDDGSTPAGTLVNDDFTRQDGYTLYTKGYAEIVGDGVTMDESETKNNGKLVLYRKIRLGTAPTAPTATIGGTVVSTQTSQRQEDGFTLYDYQWAEGDGRISENVDVKNAGALTLTTVRFFVTDDGATPAGTVISTDTTLQDGVTLTTKVYASGTGQISITDDTRQGGALLLRTIRTLGTAPSTPATYTLVNADSQTQDGYILYTYAFAKGDGRVSEKIETRQGGALTLTTIVFLGSTTGGTPAGTLVDESIDQRDGHTVTTRVYASGSGTISTNDDARQGGKLLLRTIRSLGTAPSTPGGYTLVSADSQSQDGYTLYTYQFANGAGRISTDVQTKNNGKLTLTNIRFLGADDGAAPAGTLVTTETVRQDGYTLTAAQYAQGAGRIATETETKNGGALTLTSIRFLGADDGAAAPGTLVSTETTQQDGYTLTAAQYASGSGTISTNDDTRQGGKLLLRTIRTLGTAPSTPSGYTLVSADSQEQDGYDLYTYTFAKGDGEISRTSDEKNNGKLVVTTIRHLTASSVTVNPTTAPAGATLVNLDKVDQDGFRAWTAVYANGTGRISLDTAYKQNGKLQIVTVRFLDTDDGSAISGTLVNDDFTRQDGYTLFTKGYAQVVGDGIVTSTSETKQASKLVLYRITRLGSAPSTPSATIGGTVTRIETIVRQEDGFPLYDYQWAEGLGEIERRTEYLDSADAGTTGRTRVTIRHLTALGASDPTSAPAGMVKLSEENPAQDGYLLWTVIYGKGAGTIISTVEYKAGNKLIIYRRVALGTAPTTPTSIISGVVTGIEVTSRQADGYIIYESTWAEGYGVIDKSTQQRDGGLRIETWVSLGSAYNAAYMKPAGILLLRDEEILDGHNRYTVTCMQSAGGGADPTSGTMVSVGTKQSFTYPGRAKAFTTSFAAVGFTAYAHDVFFSPPIELLVDATIDISYQTSASLGSLSYALWNPDSWATVRAFWEGWNENAQSLVQSHSGYRAVGSAVTFTAGTGYAAGFDTSCMGNKVYGGSSGSITVSGGPSAPDGNTYTLAAEIDPTPAFTAHDGTKYYRKTVIYATIPAQTALPV